MPPSIETVWLVAYLAATRIADEDVHRAHLFLYLLGEPAPTVLKLEGRKARTRLLA